MELIKNKKYLLRTHDDNGFEEPKSEWIHVLFDGKNLVDKDGCCWNEWLKPLDDVFEVQ